MAGGFLSAVRRLVHRCPLVFQRPRHLFSRPLPSPAVGGAYRAKSLQLTFTPARLTLQTPIGRVGKACPLEAAQAAPQAFGRQAKLIKVTRRMAKPVIETVHNAIEEKLPRINRV